MCYWMLINVTIRPWGVAVLVFRAQVDYMGRKVTGGVRCLVLKVCLVML